MTGWATRIRGWEDPPKHVIGIIVADKFPDSTLIERACQQAIAKYGDDTVFVVWGSRLKDSAATQLVAWLDEHEQPYLVATPRTKVWPKGADTWLRFELVHGCGHVLVFHDGKAARTDKWPDKAKVIECPAETKEAAPGATNSRRRKPAAALA